MRNRPQSRARRRTDDRDSRNPVAAQHLLGVPLTAASALEVLSDPARAALLLVRTCAAVATRAAEPPIAELQLPVTAANDNGRSDHNDTGSAAATHTAATTEGDEDDDAERLEDENDDDDDDVADETEDDDDDVNDDRKDDDDGEDADARNGDSHGLLAPAATADDNNVDAIAAALELATQVVEQLQCKLLVCSSSRSRSATTNDDNDNDSRNSISSARPRNSSGDLAVAHNSNSSAGEPGVPRIKARTVNNTHCQHCSKSFNAFHRSRFCTSCGYAFCVKCVSRRQVLPPSFGFRDDAVRVCELCCRWFQLALARYFDVVALAKAPDGISSSISTNSDERHYKSTRRTSIATAAAHSSQRDDDESVAATGDHDKRQHRTSRHSVTQPAPTPPKSSASWFSGHLRAMHVGDRLPRKLMRSDADAPPDDCESDADAKRSTVAPQHRRDNTNDLALAVTYERLSRNDLDVTKQQSIGQCEDDCPDTIFEMEPVLESVVLPAPVVQSVSVQASPDSSNAPERHRRQHATKRSKFARSASFDFTNLQSAASASSVVSGSPSAGSIRNGTGGLDPLRDNDDIASDDASTTSPSARSVTSSVTSSASHQRRAKCLDDSDIVDARAKASGAAGARSDDADLPATVLRFAVDKVGETQSLRRLFGKANSVLDRYSLELDCSQGIVRVKSVFQHRFWSFDCDAVEHLSAGAAAGTARLVVRNGVDGHRSHDLQFANDDERDEFQRAVETCRGSNLHAMRRASTTAGIGNVGHSLLDAAGLALGSPVIDDVSSGSDAAGQSAGNNPTSIGSNEPTMSDSPFDPDAKLQLLAGETIVQGSEFPSTLLIGPGGDSAEPSQVWGRIRGSVAVTTFRVLFVPSEQHCYVPLCTALQGIAPYIPLFAITAATVVYPSGRRPKTSRTYSTALPSVLAISCKDVRVMRVQLEGSPHVSDERAQHLALLITKLADDAQRFRVIERTSPDASLLGGGSPMTHLSLGTSVPTSPDADETSGASGDGTDDGVQVSSSYVQSSFAAAAAAGRRPVNGPAPSPNLRPGSPQQTLPLEQSGAFAFTYTVDCASSDVDGWSLFTDEREFKRQIGNDPSVHPFFKYYQNARGNICKSYPSKLLLPSSMTSQTLTKVTAFRAKNRLPVITYYHRRNRCVLTRSSQPLLGNLLSGSSSLSDQLLLGVYRRLPDIIRNQSIASVSSRPLYIFDARKLQASTGNRLLGKGGVETPQDYPGAIVHHLNIANMYRMQSSFTSLVKLLLPGAIDDNDKTWLLRVESTRWLHHVRAVLDGAMKIARVLELEGASVLVHCSDGWDRTAQLTALAQLMIDPFFRTIRGFAVLVEKDWCAFGHKFAERLGADRRNDPQRSKSSPVMLQFLDAVWQIQRQFPRAFEFTERLLLHVANALTSGLYGTFLYDSRLQRDVNSVRTQSVSVWTPVLMNPSAFTNAEYVSSEQPIWPWTGIQIMHLWEGYFLQWHPKYYNCHWVASATSANMRNPTAAAATADTGSADTEASLPQQEEQPKVQCEQTPTPAAQHKRNASYDAAAAAVRASDIHHQELQQQQQQQRDGSFDSADSAARIAGNLPSPVPDAPRSSSSNPTSVRSSRSSSVRQQTAQAPKLPMRNVFIYRS